MVYGDAIEIGNCLKGQSTEAYKGTAEVKGGK
jgi:hypothetical protein